MVQEHRGGCHFSSSCLYWQVLHVIFRTYICLFFQSGEPARHIPTRVIFQIFRSVPCTYYVWGTFISIFCLSFLSFSPCYIGTDFTGYSGTARGLHVKTFICKSRRDHFSSTVYGMYDIYISGEEVFVSGLERDRRTLFCCF